MSSIKGRADQRYIRLLIAQELSAIAARLEAMGDQLCNDPDVVRNHFSALQGIDELCQRHGNLSRILQAEDMEAALDDITLESLRARMLKALATSDPCGS